MGSVRDHSHMHSHGTPTYMGHRMGTVSTACPRTCCPPTGWVDRTLGMVETTARRQNNMLKTLWCCRWRLPLPPVPPGGGNIPLTDGRITPACCRSPPSINHAFYAGFHFCWRGTGTTGRVEKLCGLPPYNEQCIGMYGMVDKQHGGQATMALADMSAFLSHLPSSQSTMGCVPPPPTHLLPVVGGSSPLLWDMPSHMGWAFPPSTARLPARAPFHLGGTMPSDRQNNSTTHLPLPPFIPPALFPGILGMGSGRTERRRLGLSTSWFGSTVASLHSAAARL